MPSDKAQEAARADERVRCAFQDENAYWRTYENRRRAVADRAILADQTRWLEHLQETPPTQGE
jgi:hypothetical protein